MKKIRNKFIILVFLLIATILFFGIYKSYFSKVDRSTYTVLLKGKGTLNKELLELNDKVLLNTGDIVRTIGNESLAIVEWGDGSITRLGGNSSVQVDELFVDNDLLQINLSFKLLSGKSWSNVINFMGEGSYFKESFRDIEAGVRGTVFNVDLLNDYISVAKHNILLTDNKGTNYKINENEPFSIKTFSLIKLENFIREVKDKAFEELNNNFDKTYIRGLTIKMQNKLQTFKPLGSLDIDSMSIEKKKEKYNELLAQYQELNFVNSDSEELFSKKIEYKKALITLASEENKKALVENTLLDFKEVIDSKNQAGFDLVISVLNENIETVQSIETNFKDYLKDPYIPEELKQSFGNNFDILEDIFGTDLKDKFSNFSVEDIKSLKRQAEQKIGEGLDTIVDLKNKAEGKIEDNLNTNLNTAVSLKEKIENFLRSIFGKKSD